MGLPRPRRVGAAVSVVAALVTAGCSSGGPTTTSESPGATLVVDNSFDLKTADPGRAFELTGTKVSKALYETAVTFQGADVSKPVPSLTTYIISDDNRVVTLTLTGSHAFSSGNQVTIDDIVWSYQRVQGIAGNPSFLLKDPAGQNVTVAKTSDSTMTLTSSVPNPQLPFILPNPSLGVVDSKTVMANRRDDDEGGRRRGLSQRALRRVGALPTDVLRRQVEGRVRPQPALHRN